MRKYYNKKRTTKRRFYKRKPRVQRQVNTQNLVSIVRTCKYSDFTLSWTGFQGHFYHFKLGDLPNLSDFYNLFDEYSIRAVKLTLIPQWSTNDQAQSLANNAASGQYRSDPIIWYGKDTDGDQSLSSELTILQSSSTKMIRNVNKPFSIYTPVRFKNVVQNTVLGNVTGRTERGWLNTQNYNVEHNGIWVAGTLPVATTTAPVTYTVYAKFYLKFRKAI